jgi:pimeloyl-ACP methyl ester carboxylesterase
VELYFGAAPRSLFGVLHEPPRAGGEVPAVVMCAPLWREGVRAHRVLRQLGARLAKAGHVVMRFDYTGAGDSAGDTEQGDVDTWLGDVGAAIEEVRRKKGVARVTLLGLRFGATLAALAAGQRDDVERLVLWEPVHDGAAYLEEGRAEQRAWADLYATWRRLPRAAVDDPGDEVLGYRVTPAMRESIAAVSLARVARLARTAGDVLVIERSAPGAGGLPPLLEARGARVHHEVLAEAEVWKQRHAEGAGGARETQELIASWLARSVS